MVRRRREPEPQGIDDYTGFKVPLSTLSKDWQGFMTVNPDKRNPQDYLRGRADKMTLPFARPETPDVFIAVNLITEDEQLVYDEDGTAMLDQGITPEL